MRHGTGCRYHAACLEARGGQLLCPLCAQREADEGAAGARRARGRGSSAADEAGSPTGAGLSDSDSDAGDADDRGGGGGGGGGGGSGDGSNVHTERLARANAAGKGRPPLTELFDLLGRASTAVDVRTTKLVLAPAAKARKVKRDRFAAHETHMHFPYGPP